MRGMGHRAFSDVDTGEQAPGSRGLQMAPFAGMRYDISRVHDLAAVTAPPYDVLDDESVRVLESSHANNIVRVILPRDNPDSPGQRYRYAGETLRSWLSTGVLTVDPEPALYVYEQTGRGVMQRGLLGGVGLRGEDEGVILPHEDTMPGPVRDRLQLMEATRANLEPIFLLYGGGGYTSELVEKVCTQDPLAQATTGDGITHRLWRIADVDQIGRVNHDLAPHQALIADGHHRYATYLRLQRAARDRGGGDGPWDYGLALLVDVNAYPPALNSIHRVVRGLSVTDAVARIGDTFSVRPLGDLDEALSLLRDGGPHTYALVGQGRHVLLSNPVARLLEQFVPRSRPESWRRLDATVLHFALLGGVWQVGDSERTVSYHHDLSAALREADRTAGTAVLLNPATVDSVLEVTVAGSRMPRKSTSFGPKPRTGLVVRSLSSG